MGALSPWHIILIAVVLLLLFGPNKLPELGRSFGKMFREFKDATNNNSGNTNDNRELEAPKKRAGNCFRYGTTAKRAKNRKAPDRSLSKPSAYTAGWFFLRI